MQGATCDCDAFDRRQEISIHAPHAGGDQARADGRSNACDFNPRPPCRGRHAMSITGLLILVFQSTPPMQGATPRSELAGTLWAISIHAPHAGGDPAAPHVFDKPRHFNPRPPCRGRPVTSSKAPCSADFNPRPPCRGRLHEVRYIDRAEHFNPRPPCRGRHKRYAPRCSQAAYFNPRPPCRGRPGNDHKYLQTEGVDGKLFLPR